MTFALRLFITITSCILFACTAGKTQNIDAAINAYAEKYSPERAYIHYDKPVYSAGETIRFKVYLLQEILPAVESKTLYTDWIDDKGNLLSHIVSPLAEGFTYGQFDIPADYKGKQIQVRAYTKWMLNFDSAFLYNKFIRILTKNINQPVDKNVVIPSISFFPEGGDAVEGITNKIAFKANDQWGRPVGVKGVILSNDGKIADSIQTTHDGMGYVLLTPQPGLNYTAKWKDEKGVEHITPLPAIKQTGVALQVAVVGNSRYFDIRYTKDIADAMDTLNIIGTMYQHEVFRTARSTKTASIKGSVPVKDLVSGILVITVFDKHWNALAERITYVNNAEYLFQPDLEVQHWGLNKRARNELKITIPDSLSANLSISVTDAGINTDSSNTIISHFLLSSELKGNIYNPAYYFSERSEKISQQLDLVMLTHGWRRFKWEQVIAGKNPPLKFARDTAYLTLSGKIYGMLPGQIGPGTNIILLVKQKDTPGKFLMLPINPDGRFNDPSALLLDTAQIYYQFPKSKGLNDASVQFMPERLPAPSLMPNATGSNNFWPDTTGISRQQALANEANELAERLKIKTLENVTVTSKTKSAVQVMDEKYTSGLFQGGDSYQFDLLNDPFSGSAMNIFSYLQGKVAGLQVDATGNPPSLQWRGGAPQLYLDEVATDADFISSVNVADVAYIKVFRPPFMGGFNGANGAIAIYTRRGNDVKSEPGKGLNNNKVYGYTLIKEFYSPNYGSFSQRNEQRDLRTTLYWNPAVILPPGKNQAILTFYNNDVSHAFRVVIEGMTRDGRLAHIEQIME